MVELDKKSSELDTKYGLLKQGFCMKVLKYLLAGRENCLLLNFCRFSNIKSQKRFETPLISLSPKLRENPIAKTRRNFELGEKRCRVSLKIWLS